MTVSAAESHAAERAMRTISVLIPTWRRPDELADCLAALGRQTVSADQIVVTVREDDEPTRRRLDAMAAAKQLPAGFEALIVPPVPLTAAMNAGLARTTGALVALTDDDAEPWPDWLERCRDVLDADAAVAGVGGRDWQPHERWSTRRVGTISWYGRVTGNHHLGAGPARDVDVLKGVNACFRGDLLRARGFDRRLRGQGNVNHWELSLCLSLRRAGWRLVFDPAIALDHRPAVRHDGDVNARGGFERASHRDGVYNETLATLDFFPAGRRAVFLAWAAAVGTRTAPGLLQLARLVLRGSPNAMERYRASFRGRLDAVGTFYARRPATE